jgi:quercetin dioxygenase-like cupin family protein
MRNSVPQIRWGRVLSVALCLTTAMALAQSYPPPYPRKNAKRVLSNDRVDAWDVTWPKGEATPLHEHQLDQLSVTLVGGSVRITKLGRAPVVDVSKVGSLYFTPKGTVHTEEGVSDVPQHKIMLEIKLFVAPPIRPMNGVQGAFPQEGAVQLWENDDLTAWDFTWKPGQVVPRHINDFDSVTVFLEGGTIRSVFDKGGAKEATRSFGEVVYSEHSMDVRTEQAVRGSPRAIIIQLR